MCVNDWPYVSVIGHMCVIGDICLIMTVYVGLWLAVYVIGHVC